MGYRYVIFDADHTLIDFDADERRAFRAAFMAAGVPLSEKAVEACWAFSAQNWDDLGLNAVHLPAVQAGYHRMYRDHVRTLFDFVERSYDLRGKRREAEEAFMAALCLPSVPVCGAEETVKALAKSYALCIATNGLAEMQRGRLKEFAPFFRRIFISEELGTIKPDRAFFRTMLRELDAEAKDCLMVGDSLSSDAAGAAAVGMDCIWFNRRGCVLPDGVSVRAEIRTLKELLTLL